MYKTAPQHMYSPGTVCGAGTSPLPLKTNLEVYTCLHFCLYLLVRTQRRPQLAAKEAGICGLWQLSGLKMFLLKRKMRGDYETLPVTLLDVLGESCRNKLLRRQCIALINKFYFSYLVINILNYGVQVQIAHQYSAYAVYTYIV